MKNVLIFAMLAVTAGLLFSCGDDDSETGEEVWERITAGSSSDSLEPSSDSLEPSSSSLEPSSSSLDASSSSSVRSSSSLAPSSSSLAPSSSSSVSSSSSFSGGIVYGVSVKYGGEDYKTVVIGTQTWFARNLNYTPSSGIFISCDIYDCATYGRLYDWSTVMGFPSDCNENTCSNQIQSPHRGICPEGWHIPSKAEWDVLTAYIGGSGTEGKKLKTTGGWKRGGNGTDDYGFSALPGGYGNSGNNFDDVGDIGYWWSAGEYNSTYAWSRQMDYDRESADWYGYEKSYMHPVRCVKD